MAASARRVLCAEALGADRVRARLALRQAGDGRRGTPPDRAPRRPRRRSRAPSRCAARRAAARSRRRTPPSSSRVDPCSPSTHDLERARIDDVEPVADIPLPDHLGAGRRRDHGRADRRSARGRRPRQRREDRDAREQRELAHRHDRGRVDPRGDRERGDETTSTTAPAIASAAQTDHPLQHRSDRRAAGVAEQPHRLDGAEHPREHIVVVVRCNSVRPSTSSSVIARPVDHARRSSAIAVVAANPTPPTAGT